MPMQGRLCLEESTKRTATGLISEFGDTVLAARMGKDNEVRFTTWQYDYDRIGVHRGITTKPTMRDAKLDFAVRAGLIDKKQLLPRMNWWHSMTPACSEGETMMRSSTRTGENCRLSWKR